MGNSSRLAWPASLDVPALLAEGWRPSPFREFIVKVHSRCDLSCDYCYMYEMADQSWRDQPRAMSEETADVTARRIGEHACAHGLREITLILHGGEPLLAGRDLISRLVTSTRRSAGPGITVHAAVQTNGVGLSDAYLALFDELDVRVGVSVDGYADAHDRHRRYASGRGSYRAVAAALERLRRFPHLYGGLLCTVDLDNDPVRTYRALADFGPPKIDFLLPHGTWLNPPPGRTLASASTPYADWLTEIFDYWYPKPQTRIRLFEEIMHLLLGGASGSEIVGLAPAQMVVIETDGSIEQEDTLKAAYAGAAATSLHVARDPLDAALLLPEIAARQIGVRALAAQCRTCPVRSVCGGGLYSHRYDEDTGFLNPSVYCPDLFALIRHIRGRVLEDLNASRARDVA
jgi:uncharacterized protein